MKNKSFTPHHFWKKSGEAFTLIELIIAVFVIAVGTMGAFTVLQKVIISTSLSSSRLTASYLAQEGIEIVRNIRDTNWLEGAPSWNDGLTACLPSGQGCEADYSSTDLVSYQDRYLEINGGFYNYTPGKETRFTRKITIVPTEPYELEVTVQVEWEEFGKTHKISVQENLYNWYSP